MNCVPFLQVTWQLWGGTWKINVLLKGPPLSCHVSGRVITQGTSVRHRLGVFVGMVTTVPLRKPTIWGQANTCGSPFATHTHTIWAAVVTIQCRSAHGLCAVDPWIGACLDCCWGFDSTERSCFLTNPEYPALPPEQKKRSTPDAVAL